MESQASAAELLSNLTFLDLPIGAYVVSPDGRFVACNRSVRQMLDLPLEGPVEASLADFYANPGQRSVLLQKAIEAEAKGRYLERELIKFRVKGRDLYAEDYCKPLRDPATREIIGYVGCLVDVTKEQEIEKKEVKLESKVEELTYDIGRVLHANTSTLLMAQQTLDGVAEALAQRSLKEVIATPTEELDDQMVKEAGALANALEHLLQSVEPARRLQ